MALSKKVDSYQAIVKLLNQKRYTKGLTARQIASKAGLNYNTVRRALGDLVYGQMTVHASGWTTPRRYYRLHPSS